jgi:hypothetical protein
MAAYRAAWKAANPDKVRTYQRKHNRKRRTAAWKAANADKLDKLRIWKADYQRRKRAEARGVVDPTLTPDQQAALTRRRIVASQVIRARRKFLRRLALPAPRG